MILSPEGAKLLTVFRSDSTRFAAAVRTARFWKRIALAPPTDSTVPIQVETGTANEIISVGIHKSAEAKISHESE